MHKLSSNLGRSPFHFGEETLTSSQALSLVSGASEGYFSRQTLKNIARSNDFIKDIVERGEIIYGINTGFGPLCTTLISPEKTIELQYNILKSHSVGVGAPCSPEISKLMLLLKIHALALGHSGVQGSTLERMHWHLTNDIIPVVPRQGSVGASGDLAPLAHLFLPLIGLGQVFYKRKIVNTASVLKKFNLAPIVLGPKEGLALINGTQFMCAYAINIVDRLHNCLAHADIIGAMTLEAYLGSLNPFHASLHQLRPHKGSIHVAARLRGLLHQSEIMHSHQSCGRIQDPYSLRCMPQVHGASRTAWLHLKEIVEIEINSVTDNPIILDDGEALSGGNFHGQPIAIPMDYAGVAAAEIGNISDRRIYLMLEGKSEGLPKLLMHDTGLNSGFMLPQYTTAALVSENKSLCFPASADSIPTSLGQEDHVSMGSISGRKTLKIVDNLEKILAIELLCASQAFDFRRPLKSSAVLESCHTYVRDHIDHADQDRVFSDDINKSLAIIKSRALINISNNLLNTENEDNGNRYNALFEVY